MSIFETAGPALTGIASGIRDAAQTQQTQTNVALSKEGLKAAQEEAKERARLNAPVVLADAYRATPITPFAKPIIDQELAKQGYDPNAAEVPTHAWMKAQQAIASNPDIQMGIFTSYKSDIEAKAKPYNNDIEMANKAIKDLEIQRASNRDSTTPESGLANEKIDKQIEKQKQIIAEANGRLQPFMEQRAQADAQIANVHKIMEIQQIGKMDAKQRQVYEAYKNDPKYVGLSPLALVQKASEGLKPKSVSHLISPDSTSSTGYRYNYYNPDTGQHDVPGPEAPPKSEGIGSTERGNIRFDALVKAADGESLTRPHRIMFNIMPRIERAAQEYKTMGNAAILDDALLYSLNKMNDPTSVVMIGEYMRTKELQSWWNDVKGNIGRLNKDNAGIMPSFRDQIYRAVKEAAKDKSKAYNNRMEYFRKRASKYSNDSEEIKMAFPFADEIAADSGEAPAQTPAASTDDEFAQFWNQ